MRFRVDIDGNFNVWAQKEIARAERAVQRGIASTAAAIKADWQAQIVAAGLGAGLSKAVRAEVYPKGQSSLNAAAVVFAGKRFGKDNARNIIAAHQTGPLIRARDGFWLAIPLAAAGKGDRRAQITPGEWEKRRGMRLRFVYRRNGPSLLVADGRLNKQGLARLSRSKTGRGQATVPVFLLVPQAKLPKRLSLYEAAKRIAATAPARILAAWEAA